ncbi:hypothetical protein Tco_1157962, partial [Tanacetum coccineum]
DPREEPGEEPEEDPEEDPKEDESKEEPDEAQQMDFDFGLWDESELIFPYQEMDITGDHAQRVAREETRVENIRIGAVGDRPSEATDVLAVYEESQHPKP